MELKHTNLPIEREYPKLVRDKIVELIRGRGEEVEWETIKSDDDFLKFLLKKLVEESTEAEHSLVEGSLEEELADIMEVIDEIVKLKNFNTQDIRKNQEHKRQMNGGFEKRIKLIKHSLKQ